MNTAFMPTPDVGLPSYEVEQLCNLFARIYVRCLQEQDPHVLTRLAETDSQTVDELVNNVKRWMLKLRRSNKPYAEKHLSCSAYLYDVLKLVADTYVPEPQRRAIHEVIQISDYV